MPLYETGEYFFHLKLHQDLLSATVENALSSTDIKEFIPVSTPRYVRV